MRRVRNQNNLRAGISEFVTTKKAAEILAGLEACETPADVLAWCDRVDDGTSVAVQMVRYAVQLEPDLVADRFATAVRFVQRLATYRRSDAIREWAERTGVGLYKAFGGGDSPSMLQCPTCGTETHDWNGFYCADHCLTGREEAEALLGVAGGGATHVS